MADVKTEKQKVQEITEKLEQGIKELFESEKYKTYLNTMSKFHKYSINNTILIAMQNPDATLVAGFQAWKKKFERHVNKGEKGIRILAPAPYKIKEEQEKLDPKTKEIMLDSEGKPIMEEVEITIPAFRAVSVFDVAQTEGKELPELEVKELLDSVEDYENFMQALIKVSPVPIEFEEIEGDAKGYFSQSTHGIAVQEGMSQSQTLKTVIHEVAHAKLHDRELNKRIGDAEFKDRNTQEVEAESIAYTVCQHFGIETSDYSFSYIAGWSSGKEMTELKASLDTIKRTASEIITGIEDELSKIQEYTVEQDTEVSIMNARAEKDALPDGMVGISQMHEYGYTWEEMLPLTQERALELFDYGLSIYRLYEDGSEVSIEDRSEVMEHGGMFGIEKGDWEKYMERQTMRESWKEGEINQETKLLYGKENQFGIYQLNDSPQAREVRFMSSDFFETSGVAISRENYNFVYAAPLEEGMTLDDIYTRFNINHPKDFSGHSLSVSDVVVLHQDGKNSCHFVDFIGYKEVPEFIREAVPELQTEQSSVIDEVVEILGEIAQEYAGEEKERENAVFLVNYNEWKEVEELDLGQNYFAIEDQYGDGDFRLLWLQNTIKDITPAGVQYNTYEEAAQALYEKEREIANLSHNKENNIGSYMVNGKAQLERIMEAREWQKHKDMENDKVSYYVIEDISTWAENKSEKSKLERFDNYPEALEQFKTYRKKYTQVDDKTRTTLGFRVQGSEFDVLYTRNNENILSLDFTHSSKALQSNHFMDDLQILCHKFVDKVRVYREMTDKEVKDFVKERFKFNLERSGLDDIAMYMSRFDTLYEEGKLEHLMPSVNQKRIVESIPIERWENPYFELEEIDQMAFAVKDKFVSIQTCTEGYDYSIYHADYSLFDGGVYDNPDISIHAALADVLEGIGARRSELVPVDYDELTEKAETVEKAKIEEKHIVFDFRERTKEMFHDINGQTPEDVEQTVFNYIKSKIDEHELDAEVVDVILSGSRCRGLESDNSDIDIVVEYKGSEHEDTLFNIFNEDGLMIGGMKVDINPITEEKTGTLATYLPGVESYLAEKKISILATQIDQFSYECDIYQYWDMVEDREVQIAKIIEDIRNGNTDYLNDFLNAIIAEGIRVGIIDIFGQGVELDDSEAVQTIRKAQELLNKLSEYKPLSKADELEENIFDNVLNKDSLQKEENHVQGRISVKEKLAEKKAIIEQRDISSKSVPEKDTEKKNQREM